MLAARIRKLVTARARENKRTARMLANARKDHSIPLSLVPLDDLLIFTRELFFDPSEDQAFIYTRDYLISKF